MTTMSTRPTALRLVGATEMKNENPAKDVETKAVGVLEIKDEEKGEVEAIIATLGVVDKDGDIIREGAIKSGAKVKMSAYGHDAMWGETPVGKGEIIVREDLAIFRGKMFLTTQRGREVFSVLKEMGADQEWSFGFRVTGWEAPDEKAKGAGATRILTKLDAFEVSPVMRGAGVGTRTLAVKEEKPTDPAPESEPTPTPEEIAAKEKADADAKAAKERDETEAKAAAERKAAERKRATQAAIDDFDRVRRNLKRLGYVA